MSQGKVLLCGLNIVASKTPIALFAYNRPKHVELALASISRCSRLDECRLHVFCDGPARPEDAAKTSQVRKVVRKWASRLGGHVVERERNLGLAHSIVKGVTEMCEKHGKTIVLEDDFVVSPDFLLYMLQALDQYADKECVCQISGYMFPALHPETPDCFFLPLTTTRGWATWHRAWRLFDWQAQGWERLETDRLLRHRFDLDGCYPYTQYLRDRLGGKNQSWGILWLWSTFARAGLVLHPRRSLVWVGGFDGTGTHCSACPDYEQPDMSEFRAGRLSSPIIFPAQIGVDEAAFARVKAAIGARGTTRDPGSLSRRVIQHKTRQYWAICSDFMRKHIRVGRER